jgi:hypothetical protein
LILDDGAIANRPVCWPFDPGAGEPPSCRKNSSEVCDKIAETQGLVGPRSSGDTLLDIEVPSSQKVCEHVRIQGASYVSV